MDINGSDRWSCAVIGYGSWATAIVKLLSGNGERVGWYITNNEVLEGLNEDARNPKYLRDVKFDLNRIDASNDINYIVENYKIIIMAMPSAYVKNFLEPLTASLEDKFVVSAIKGIVPGNYLTVVEYLHEHYNLSYRQMGIITGPSHAEEVALERLSYLTIVSPEIELAYIMGRKIECSYIRTNYSTDLYGTEYASVLKNIYAISVGMAVGLGYGDNFLSVLISNCAREMNNFLETSFPDKRDTRESAYLGDLLVTCYSTYSRNRRLGLLMGKGFTIKSALNEMTMVAEGYFATECIRHLSSEQIASMPIAEMVYKVLYKGASARASMKRLSKELI
ncbi:MAG: NAD(P)H-dependent glycerol-3-phosphate dehydrogenase [Rikenellaceae bacterium]